MKPEERRGGDALSVYLAFVPIDIREITNTKFEAYIVNDSNYYISYSYISAEGSNWHLRSVGTIEPNTKLFIEEFDRETLNSLERVCIQFVAYKHDKTFMLKPSVDVQIRIDAVKFYKLHTFKENDFFEQPALIYTVIENDKVARPLVIDAKSSNRRWLARFPMTARKHISSQQGNSKTKTRRLSSTYMQTNFSKQQQDCLPQTFSTISLTYSENDG